MFKVIEYWHQYVKEYRSISHYKRRVSSLPHPIRVHDTESMSSDQ